MAKGKQRGRPANDPRETRDKLLEAAARAFNRDGYFGTNTNKIAREAGFAPATFYRHFPDKKAVFLAAYAQWVDADWTVIEERARAGASAETIARAIIGPYLARHREWSGFRRSMHALIASDDEARRFHLEKRRGQLERLTALLDTLGAAPRSSEELLAHFLTVERLANAAADGDIAALGLSDARFEALILREMADFLSAAPRRPHEVGDEGEC